MVPRTTSRVYTGRGEIDERLTQVFLYDHSKPPKQQRTFVIIGVGDIGKSEVCLKFAEDHRDEYVEINVLPMSCIRLLEHQGAVLQPKRDDENFLAHDEIIIAQICQSSLSSRNTT